MTLKRVEGRGRTDDSVVSPRTREPPKTVSLVSNRGVSTPSLIDDGSTGRGTVDLLSRVVERVLDLFGS